VTSRHLVRAALLVALLVLMLGRAVTRVFVLNFSSTGPNATALLAGALLTGLTIPVALRSYSRRRDHALVGLAGAGVLGSLLADPVGALVGAAVAASALTPLLVADATRLRGRVGAAVGLGLLVVVALRAATGATAPNATTLGRGGVTTLTLALVVASLAAHEATGDTGRNTTATAVDVAAGVPWFAPVAAVLLLATAWLGAPVASARWADVPILTAVVATVAGLVAGTWVVDRRPVAMPVVGAGVAVVAGLGGVLVGGPVAVAGVTLATAALPVLAAPGGRGQVAPWRAGLVTACVQGGGLVALFGFVFALNAAFAPAGASLRGTAPPFAFGLAALVGLTAVGTAARVADVSPAPPAAPGTGRCRRAVLAGLLTGTGAGLATVGRAPRADATPPSTPSFRVVTYNVHRYVDAAGTYNLEALADLLRAQRAEVVGLQETTGARLTTGHTHGVRWLAARLGYHCAMAPATSAEGYGVALLSTWPIRDVRSVLLPRTDGAPRVALRAVVNGPDGPLPVVVAHLATTGPVRTRQARRVRRLVAGADRAVVLGDFNVTPTKPPIDVMTTAFTDAWAVAGSEAVSERGATFDAGTPSRRIDYVFVRGFQVTNATVFGTPAVSDHRGVRATLRPP